MADQPPFTIGIEEEYLLVDIETGDLRSDPPASLMDDLKGRLGERVTPEFLRAQVEVGTGVCRTVGEARAELGELRSTIIEVAAAYGIAPIAASTHPLANWRAQPHTDKDRYNVLAHDMQVVARRLLISGMHVHVGVAPDDLRIDLMSQVSYFLPHLLALSCSSPFWQGEATGLRSYRLAVFDELPRTGPAPEFASFGEFQRTVAVLVRAGLIQDGSKLWWDLRPHHRFPTLEMRITDLCTLIEDAAAVAATYQCLLRMLWRLRLSNQRWRTYSSVLVGENRWRAQRYGLADSLVDFGRGELVAFRDLVGELQALIAEDAEALGCTAEIAHLTRILERGNSADRQIATYEAALAEGHEKDAALRAVVRQLMRETAVT
ncbi:MAG: carboxylate-amine ligase [Rhizobiales bacterium]|nr:carboxylate-amine ligase [Hyphomicrobiales bacterium]